MKVSFFISFIFLIYFFSGCTPKEKYETKLMECIYQAFSNNGDSLRKLLLDYEKNLIENDFLKDNSGYSYKLLLEKFSNDELDKEIPDFFCIKYNELNRNTKQNSSMSVCKAKLVLKYSDEHYQKCNSIINLIKNSLTKSFGETKSREIGKDMLNILTVKDFNLDIYKLKIYLLFCLHFSEFEE